MNQDDIVEAHHYAHDHDLPDRYSFIQGYYFGRAQAGNPYLTSSFFCAGMSVTSFLSMGGGLNWWDTGVIIAIVLASTPIARAATRFIFRKAYPEC